MAKTKKMNNNEVENKLMKKCFSLNFTHKEWGSLILAEVAAYLALGYFLILINVNGSIWVSTLIIFVLINLSIWLCPLVRRACK
ncbi:MAG: hypothetical protein ABIH82_03225 [Candidatus Woesearchaeota archaeon]